MNTLLTANENFDYFEKIKLQLTFKIAILMSGILSLLGITFILQDHPAIYFILVSLAICIAVATFTFITKKYKVSATFFAISGVCISSYTLINLDDVFHFVDPLWMLIISLFTYFTLGKIYGTATIIIQFTAVAYYIIFKLNTNLAIIDSIEVSRIYSLAVNSMLCALVIAYLISQFIQRNAYAASQYRRLTEELELKNELVVSQHDEKTAMLKEIHHRVKNNLQVITSLLRLQSRDMVNPESVKHFKEAIDRISAMALIHNQMYQSKNLNRVQLEPYLNTLSKNILSSYTVSIPVKMVFDIKLAHTPSNTIVPIALLFNELVSNSLEHAFCQKNEGQINVSISTHNDSDIKFVYQDNGEWKTPEKADSFGLELIDTLAEQLNGTVKHTTENGTRYEFILKSLEE